MRVDFATYGAEPSEQGKASRAAQTGASGTAASGASGSGSDNISGLDQAQFSSDQTRSQSLATQVLEQPEVREDKVEALQQAIGSGQYSVPPSQIADALVNDLGGETWN
jgi:flagellar biosynthesis anti-sigma factor FlgM